MVSSRVLAGTALVGVVALAGCSSSATSSDDSSASASAAASGASSPGLNDAATGAAATSLLLDTQASSDTILTIPNPALPSMVQSCQQQGLGITPVVVINYTDQAQTFNYTDNTELAGVAGFVSPNPTGEFNCSLLGDSIVVATSQPVTVPAGQTLATVVLAGGQNTGVDKQEVQGQDHNMSIGGGAGGNTQWYDFYLRLKPPANSFQNWELGYENTGGLDPSQNTQAGLLNVVECSMSSDGTITTGAAVINGTLTTLPQTTIATPYGSNQNRWAYNTTNPICLGFFDQNAAGVAFNPAS